LNLLLLAEGFGLANRPITGLAIFRVGPSRGIRTHTCAGFEAAVSAVGLCSDGATDQNRTGDPLLTRQVLWLTELQ
jgi:hypothetical protein